MPKTRSISVKSLSSAFKRQRSMRQAQNVVVKRTRQPQYNDETPLRLMAFEVDSPAVVSTKNLKSAKDLHKTPTPSSPHDSITKAKDYMITQLRNSSNVSIRESEPPGGLGKVSISELRIPIMWREKEHFRHKGDSRKFALFAVFRIDSQVRDTRLLCDVDRTCTDIAFSDVAIFTDVHADFVLSVSIYSVCLDSLPNNGSTSVRIKRRLKGSFSRSLGHKFGAIMKKQLDSDIGTNIFQLVASADLKLSDCSNMCTTHNMRILDAAEHSCPPLLDHFCCRLVAQPKSAVQPIAHGYLNVEIGGSVLSNVYCSLQAAKLKAWPNDTSLNLPAILELSLSERCITQLGRKKCSLILSVPQNRRYAQYLVSCTDEQMIHKWHKAIQTQIDDCKLWGWFASESTTLEVSKPVLPLASLNTGRNLYEEISITSPTITEPVVMPDHLRSLFEFPALPKKDASPPASVRLRRKLTANAAKRQRRSISSFFLSSAMETDV